ncbi:MAG: hypothetical protein MR663_10820 [Lachnospiraceae bacterium]|nr:hypothetical protein [Lachnospiraceae bacterium]MDY2620616.1 hypothetical protein [Agathobacter sp.]
MKKLSCISLLIIMILYFLIYPQNALMASRRGLTLWFEQILPTLLPFSVISYIVLHSNLFSHPAHEKNHSFLRIQPEEWYVIFCGFLFGFPIGSKLSADLYEHHRIVKKRAQILACFTNNLSPVFVTSVLVNQLHFSSVVPFFLLLYGIPLCICLALLSFIKPERFVHEKKASRFQLNMQIVDAGIINGFETLIKICGYIMMFSIFAEIAQSIPYGSSFPKLVLTGCLEVTNGISALSQFSCNHFQKYLLTVLFLALNGISGLFQTASLLSVSNLSIKQYLKMKLLLIAAIMAIAPLLFLRLII